MDTVSSIGEEILRIQQRKSELNAEIESLNEQEKDLERRIIDLANVTGSDVLAGGGMRFSVDRESAVYSYDPELWPETLEYLVSSGYGNALHRRLTQGVLAEMDANGKLPRGIRRETITKVTKRRV